MVLPMPPVLGCMGSFLKKENRSSVPNRCSMSTRAVSMLLVLGSKLPTAVKFKNWVTAEVF